MCFLKSHESAFYCPYEQQETNLKLEKCYTTLEKKKNLCQRKMSKQNATPKHFGSSGRR